MNPTVDKALSIFGSIVMVGAIATALSPRSQLVKVIDALGRVFIGGLSAAKDLDG